MQQSLLRTKHPGKAPALVIPASALLIPALAMAILLPPRPVTAAIPPGYTGKSYKDSVLEVPGRVRLFRFDEGTKGMTWFDIEGRNIWYCKVREPAAVGLQLMGAGGDKWEPGKAEPGMTLVKDECYLAQTNTSDWTKYTVRVKEKGAYNLSFLSAANSTTIPFVKVSFLNGTDSASTGQVTLPLTSYFHNWVYVRNLATIALDTGLQVMRFDIVGNGPMNINYIDFAPATGVSLEGPSKSTSAQGFRIRRASRLPDGRLQVAVDGGAPGSLGLTAYNLAGKALFTHEEAMFSPGGDLQFRAPAGLHGLVLLRLSQGAAKSGSRPVILGD